MSEGTKSLTSPPDLLNRIIAIFPAFAQQWNSPSNLFKADDGTFNYHGLFAELSHFTRDHFESFPPSTWPKVSSLLLDCMDASHSDLANAAATCYLENLIDEPCSEILKANLSGEPLKFFRNFFL